MRIIFDIDGTMTDYHAYIETYALPWFYKRYGLRSIKPDWLELEDILDLQAMLQMRHGCTPSQQKGPVPGYSRSRSAGERPRKKESSPSSILGRRLRSAIRMSDPLWKPSCRSRERG